MGFESLWVVISVAAATLQTARNALQRKLTGILSAMGATSTRFVFGLPFALAYFAALLALGVEFVTPSAAFLAWCLLGSIGQVGGMLSLILLLQLRNFTVGIAYTKTELIQVAILGLLILGDPLTFGTTAAILIATAGVMLLSVKQGNVTLRALALGWTERAALLGLAVGAGYTIAALSIRGAAHTLAPASFTAAGAETLVTMLAMQTLMMLGYLAWREPAQITRVFRSWRASALPGLTGAAASAGWMTAMGIEPAAHVRMIGLLEVILSYGVGVIWFREKPTTLELAGTALIVGGIFVLLGSL